MKSHLVSLLSCIALAASLLSVVVYAQDPPADKPAATPAAAATDTKNPDS